MRPSSRSRAKPVTRERLDGMIDGLELKASLGLESDLKEDAQRDLLYALDKALSQLAAIIQADDAVKANPGCLEGKLHRAIHAAREAVADG